ncbi:probable WRKY transcription factor 67 [Typha angustifolia]|uniref:probable WRKY transcription factor 67 n=1 Tax=Typha angustifolia TaxID=59011 RepID=UPI003C2B9816
MASPMVGKEVASDAEKAIDEVVRGYKLTTQLQELVRVVLNGSDGLSEADVILEEVLQTFRTSLSILKSNQNLASPSGHTNGNVGPNGHGSGRNQGRKRDCSGWSIFTTAPHYDGYQWRKYGNKNISRNKYPRCYYRCTYLHECNCLARKRVQQHNDEAVPLYQVTYYNEHTCTNSSIPNSMSPSNNDIQQVVVDSPPRNNSLLPRLGLGATGIKGEEEVLVSSLANVIRGCNRDAKLSSEPNINDAMSSMPCMSPSILDGSDYKMMIDELLFETTYDMEQFFSS